MARKTRKTQAKPYRQIHLNFIAISGYVVDIGTFNYKGYVGIRARIKINRKSKVTYVDTYGFKNQADVMSIACEIGNQVYIEGRLCNVIVEHKQKKTSMTPFIRVTYCECLLRHAEVKEPSLSMITLLDNLDPVGYLSTIKVGKKNGKNRKRDDIDDEE